MDPSKLTAQPSPAQQQTSTFSGLNFMSSGNPPSSLGGGGVGTGFTFGSPGSSLAPKTTVPSLNFAAPAKTTSFPTLGAPSTTLTFPTFNMSPATAPQPALGGMAPQPALGGIAPPPQATQSAPMFNFNPPPPPATSATPQLSTGFKPAQQIQAVSAAGPPVPGFGLNLGNKTTGGTPSLGSGLIASSSTPGTTLKLTTPVMTGSTLGAPLATTSSVPTLSLTSTPLLSSQPSGTPATTAPLLSGLGTSLATSAPTLTGLGGPITAPSQPSTTTASVSAQPSIGPAMTFAQLEDMINKWTIELGEQERQFLNQATQINAWDNLLNANCIKLTSLHDTVEEVKSQQKKINCDLDFILAQQNELDACLTPLEKEYTSSIYTNDVQREKMYLMAENIDSQLKRMSEDLKETIEHINETSRSQETVDPVLQIGRILNAHMNSLQWIDEQTSKLQAEFESLNKVHENFKREIDRQYTTFY